jgi:tetratricopeptide (TPR) repeat protein
MTTLADEIVAARSELEGVSPDAWYERLEAEHEQLRANLGELRDGDAERGLLVAGIVWPYWVARGHLAEGRAWLTELLERTPARPVTFERTQALYGAGVLAFLQGDADSARPLLEESLGGARELGDHRLEADALIGLARVAIVERDPARMEQRARESATAAEAGSDERRLGTALHHVAEGLRRQRRFDEALPVYREAIELHRSLGDRRSVALELHNLGHAAKQMGDSATAAERFRNSLGLAVEVKHERLVGYCLLDFAGLAVEDGRADRAAWLVGASDALFAAIGAAHDPEYTAERESIRGAAERALGPEAFEREYDAGTAVAGEPDRLERLRDVVS